MTRAGRTRFRYDPQGRVVQRRRQTLSGRQLVWAYTWDVYDRLTAARTPDGTAWRYPYDALGRRTAKQRLGPDDATVVEQITFVWDGLHLAEQIDTDGRTITWDHGPGSFTPVTQRIRAPQPVPTTRRAPVDDAGETEHKRQADRACPAGATGGAGTGVHERTQNWYDEQFYAIVADLVGTPTALLDGDGRLTEQRRATLWGADPSGADPGAEICPLRFPGQYWDPETQLAYNRFRHYDPETARYTSPDPLGMAAGPNPCAHVSNPLHWADPLGLTAGAYRGASDFIGDVGGRTVQDVRARPRRRPAGIPVHDPVRSGRGSPRRCRASRGHRGRNLASRAEPRLPLRPRPSLRATDRLRRSGPRPPRGPLTLRTVRTCLAMAAPWCSRTFFRCRSMTPVRSSRARRFPKAGMTWLSSRSRYMRRVPGGAVLVAQAGVPSFGDRGYSRVGADGLASDRLLSIAQGFAEPARCLALGWAVALEATRDAVEVAVLDAGSIAGRGGVRGDYLVRPQR